MSTGFSPTTAAKALSEVTRILGDDAGDWSGDTADHKHWLGIMVKYLSVVSAIPELKGFASTDFSAVNTWLRSNGFDIQLDPSTDPDDFAVASVSDITVEWQTAGTSFAYDNHAGFYLTSGVRIGQNPSMPHPHIQLRTKSGDIVNIFESEESPSDWSDLLQQVSTARRLGETVGYTDYQGVVAPMVKLDLQPDISWMEGLSIGGYFIAQALQQVIFGMNHLGARAKEASAFGMMRGAATGPYTVRHPFLLWIDRPGLVVPVFQAHITQEHWIDPGNLADL